MEARYALRKSHLLDECQIAPEIFEQVMPRLSTFMQPFVRIFQEQAADQHAKAYVYGLLLNVERKNIESIAYRFGQSRLPLQSVIGWDEWDDTPLRDELRGQVKTHVGQSDGVLVFDPSGFPKSGRESVGVARQWCGRLGKVDNCQVAIYLGYVSRKGHALVDTRLYLPKEWTKDKVRLDKAGVPKASQAYRTRHQLALDMLEKNGAALPHRWIAGDDEMGRPYWFRRRLAALGEQDVLAVPSNTSMRDMAVELPVGSGRGRRPQHPWQQVEAWSQALDAQAWSRIRCARCQSRAAGGGSGEETGGLAYPSASPRRPRDVGRAPLPGPRPGAGGEGGLLPLQRGPRDAPGGMCPGGQSGTSH
jgi:SRSO17 transposase